MPISPQKICSSKILSNSRGLTLMEVMIVLIIIGAVVAFGVPRLQGAGTQMRSTVRSFSVLTKRLHHMARLNRKTYRLAIQLGEDEPEHSYWVESTERPVLLLTQEQFEEEQERLKDLSDEERAAQDSQGFKLDQSILKKPQELPGKIFFEDVELASRDVTVTSGRAYIHFLPQGFAEEAAIHITNRGEIKWTIAINPLTGQADIFDEYVSLEDLRKE